LAATDLSDSADEAIRQADRIARSNDRELRVLYVIPGGIQTHPLFPQLNQQDATEFVAVERAFGEQITNRVQACIGRDAARVHVDFGDPYAVIVRKAEELHASLLVIGESGATGLKRVFLGSVAEKVVRNAHGSVLVARVATEGAVVLAATDLSDPALPAVKMAAMEAAARGLPLVVTHNMDLWPSLVPGMALIGQIPQEPDEQTVAEQREIVRAILQTQLERLSVSADIEVTAEHDTAAAIVKLADKRRAALLVVGSRGRTGLSRLALGSVAEETVRYAHCSVLVARGEPS
jgi:nucleotide-binding universal stress UspA family protein